MEVEDKTLASLPRLYIKKKSRTVAEAIHAKAALFPAEVAEEEAEEDPEEALWQ